MTHATVTVTAMLARGAAATSRVRRAHGDTKQLPHGAAVRLHQRADAHTVCVICVRVHEHGVVLRRWQHPVAFVAQAQLLHARTHTASGRHFNRQRARRL
jgi:hypothetical protein